MRNGALQLDALAKILAGVGSVCKIELSAFLILIRSIREQTLKISVIGAGYVGLVTGGCLAGLGHEVICTDSDAEKLKTLNSGRLPIYEPGLDAVIAEARKEGRLSFRVNRAKQFRRARRFLSAWARRRSPTAART